MSFSLSIQLSQHAVSAMKAYLTRVLPHVKSSHRCESLARGLGYRTYAALIAAPAGAQAFAGGEAFAAYLVAHGFDCAGSQLYRAAASAALHQVAEQEPRLTAWGIGIGEFQRELDGRWETMDTYNHRRAAAQQQLIADTSIAPFLLSLALVQRIPPTTTIRSGTGSYKLKHIAENFHAAYPGGEHLGPVYVSNGLLIAAAIHAGFTFKTYWEQSGLAGVNVSFNMSKRHVDNLDCEIRPDGATAQMRRSRDRLRSYRPLLNYLGHIRSADKVTG